MPALFSALAQAGIFAGNPGRRLIHAIFSASAAMLVKTPRYNLRP
jgi:hypothetical protein